MEISSLIVLLSVFGVIAAVSYNSIRYGLKYGTGTSVIISVCVAALVAVGMQGQLEPLLHEYTWAIIVVVAMVILIQIVSVTKKDGFRISSEESTQQKK